MIQQSTGRRVPSSLSPSKLATFTACALKVPLLGPGPASRAPLPCCWPGKLSCTVRSSCSCRSPSRANPEAGDRCLDEAYGWFRSDRPPRPAARCRRRRAVLGRGPQPRCTTNFALEDSTYGTSARPGARSRGRPRRDSCARDHRPPRGGRRTARRHRLQDGAGTARASRARSRMAGVRVYSMFCERQLRAPARPRAAPPPGRAGRRRRRRVRAVHPGPRNASIVGGVGRRHTTPVRARRLPAEPGQSLCDHCSFRQWCPAHGGDPERAAVDVEIATRTAAGQDPLLVV